jgi:tellurite resistance protein TehA-like permease
MSTRIVREGLEPDAADAAPALPWLATMHPASFAMVMATGIVSIACLLLGPDWLAATLFWLNLASYVALWGLTVTRAVRYRTQFWGDVSHHARGVGFFTTVAATNVLGTQLLLIEDAWSAALLLWVLGTVLWALVTYTVFTALTVKTEKPSLAHGLNGGWLVAVVAAQSVSALGAQLAPGFDARAPLLLFLCLVMWLGAGMLYIWLITLIFYRYTFFAMSPADPAPPYWINMGAVAISALAGATLVAAAPQSPLLEELLPFIKGVTVLFWATATWWIPMLPILGLWRHVYRRSPLRYDSLYWGAVFPVGMYTVCTFRLAGVIDAPYLMIVPEAGIYVALAAWALTSAGLAWSIVQRGLTDREVS